MVFELWSCIMKRRSCIDFRFIAKRFVFEELKQNNEGMEFENCTVAKT